LWLGAPLDEFLGSQISAKYGYIWLDYYYKSLKNPSPPLPSLLYRYYDFIRISGREVSIEEWIKMGSTVLEPSGKQHFQPISPGLVHAETSAGTGER
jgi:hypothetical protein